LRTLPSSLLFRFAKIYEQKTFQGTLKGIWARVRYLKAEKSRNSRWPSVDREYRGCYFLKVSIGGDMAKTSESQSVKTIEDLIQQQMIEKEALLRLLIKKGVITPEEFRVEVDALRRKIQKQQK